MEHNVIMFFGRDLLGPLDDKDPEEEDYDDEKDEQGGNVELKLESKLKGLVIK
ncbi:hypothetical protein ACS0TY_023582 [Phlomoides rotata]